MLNNFIYAQTKDLFLDKLNAGEVLDEAIAFIEDTKEIWTHGQIYKNVNWDVLISPPQNAGDVVYYANGTLNVTPLSSYNESMGTAVGVIVISSGMLPDGKARMIGLHGANNNSTCT